MDMCILFHWRLRLVGCVTGSVVHEKAESCWRLPHQMSGHRRQCRHIWSDSGNQQGPGGWCWNDVYNCSRASQCWVGEDGDMLAVECSDAMNKWCTPGLDFFCNWQPVSLCLWHLEQWNMQHKKCSTVENMHVLF